MHLIALTDAEGALLSARSVMPYISCPFSVVGRNSIHSSFLRPSLARLSNVLLLLLFFFSVWKRPFPWRTSVSSCDFCGFFLARPDRSLPRPGTANLLLNTISRHSPTKVSSTSRPKTSLSCLSRPPIQRASRPLQRKPTHSSKQTNKPSTRQNPTTNASPKHARNIFTVAVV
jgi:hypothetical protein